MAPFPRRASRRWKECGAFLAAGGRPAWRELLWITVAVAGASAAVMSRQGTAFLSVSGYLSAAYFLFTAVAVSIA